MKRELGKDTIVMIKSVEEYGWEGDDDEDIPPLGTRNSEDSLTSETDSTKSKAAYGSFELLYGKTTLTFRNETDKIDVPDIQEPKDFARGHDSFSGSLEIISKRGTSRFIGAALGKWDPVKLEYSPHADHRLFEIWVMYGPNTRDLNANSCRILKKHYEVLFDSGEEPLENPIKHTLPITRRWTTIHPNWSAPQNPQDVFNGVVSDGFLTPITDPREHTRLEYVVSSLTHSGSLIVTGYNILGEQVTETVEFTSAETKVGRVYFTKIESIESVDLAGNLNIRDYDYKIR